MENNLNNRIAVINLEAYNAPEVVEDSTNEWVGWGEDNEYFNYLIELFQSSPTNNACIRGIADLIYGQGLEAIRPERDLEAYAEFKLMFRPEDVAPVCLDFKMLGWGVFKVVKNKKGDKYVRAYHFPANTIRSGKADKNGDVKKYYYAPDWSKIGVGVEPKEFDAFGFEGNKSECLLVIKAYSPGNYYYSPPDYIGGTMYADMEGEIANFHTSNIKNGLAPSMLINFFNGEPEKSDKQRHENLINAKFGGSSNTGRAVISWNDAGQEPATVDPIQLSDADKQYEFLSKESSQKIMTSHRVTSPMIFGIKDNTGLGSNADEIKNSFILLDNMTIRPMQNTLLEGIKKVLNKNGISLDIYFKTLQPLEFTDLSGKGVSKDEQEKETGVKMSADMSEEDEKEWVEYLKDKGEKIDESLWELVDEREVGKSEVEYLCEDAKGVSFKIIADSIEDAEIQIEKKYPGSKVLGEFVEDEKFSLFKLFKRFAKPNMKSVDDKGIFLIRYKYTPAHAQANSRAFCKNMVANAKMGVVYRREDIDEMGFAGVNSQFSERGKSTYSIWLYKGGVNCKHQWNRLTYRRKTINGKIIPLTEKEKAQNIRTYETTYDRVSNASANREGVPFNPPGWDDAHKKTIDMPNQGRVN